jgi:hypothetical protein
MGDINGDGFPEPLCGQGPSGTSSIKAYDGQTQSVPFETFALGSASAAGTTVAAWSTNGWGELGDDLHHRRRTKRAVPWTDLLALTCKWAHGESGVEDTMVAIARGFYEHSGFTYDGGVSEYLDFEGGVYVYSLKSALIDQSGNVNCEDVSGFVQHAGLSLGHASSLKNLKSDAEMEEGYATFVTNPHCPAGSDPTDFDDYTVYSFVYHQVVVVGSDTYDGALAHWYDLTGSSWEHVAAGSDWSLSGYWQTAGGPWGYRGLVSRYPGSGSPESVTLQTSSIALTKVKQR